MKLLAAALIVMLVLPAAPASALDPSPLPAGRSDSSFASPLTGNVRALAKTEDGNVLVGGDFVNVGGNPSLDYLVKVSPAGQLAEGFAPPRLNGPVRALAVVPPQGTNSERILIAGDFTNVWGESDQDFSARLLGDGGRDPSFSAAELAATLPMGGGIKVIRPLSDGRYLVGTDDGVRRVNENGQIDLTFSPTLPEGMGGILDIAVLEDGYLLAGVGSNGGRLPLVRLGLDGERDTDFDPPLLTNWEAGAQSILVLPEGDMIVVGRFKLETTAGDQLSGIVRLNSGGQIDEEFDAPYLGRDGALKIIPAGNSQALVLGLFSVGEGNGSPSQGLRISYDGEIDDSFMPASTFYARTGLVDGDKYWIGGEPGYVESGLVKLWAIAGVAPSPPRSVSARVEGTQVRVDWLAPEHDGGSPHFFYTVVSSPAGAACTTTEQTCDLSGLVKGVPYSFSVVATNAAGSSSPSESSPVVEITTAPSEPFDVATTRGNQSLGVSWDAPADDGGLAITGYTATAAPGGATCTTDGAGRACDITGLTNGSQYTVTVTATNAVGTSGPSNPSSQVTPATIPGAPRTVSAARGYERVSVSWDPPSSNGGAAITGYTVTAAPGGATCATAGGGRSCDITGLTNGTEYSVTVTSANSVGTGPASDPAVLMAPGAAPSKPRSVSAVRGDQRASVSWDAPADSGGFAVTGYTATAAPGGAACTTDGAGRACDITGLTNGSQYTVTVTATNAVGTSAPSNATGEFTPATLPGVPRSVTASAGFRRATVSWDSPSSNGGAAITGYTVTASPGGRTCSTTGAESCSVTGLSDFQSYTFTVTARNAVGEGPDSLASDPVTLAGDVATARLTPDTSRALTGSLVSLDAGSSSSLSGSRTFEWDVDGDGFQPGPAELTHTWSTRGSKTVRVRVTGDGGVSDTATVTVEVYPQSVEEPGVSIDSGAPYTNDRNVTLTLGWPDWATRVRVSNDGGFAGAPTFDVERRIPWVLDNSVAGAFTKVVYIRFIGSGIDQTRTYSDDVIFDNTAPVVSDVLATPASMAISPTSKASDSMWGPLGTASLTARQWVINSRATDNRSGVRLIQVNTVRSAVNAKTVAFQPRVSVTMNQSSAAVYVRMRDGAGNWTGWKTARLPTPPSAPGKPALARAGTGKVKASWSAPARNGSNPIRSYQARAVASGLTTRFCSSVAPTRTCTVGNLARGKFYNVRVRARNGVGWGPWSLVTTIKTAS